MIPSWQRINDEECRRATGSLELIGRRWSSGILLAVGRGAHRFREILQSVEGLSDRLLTVRLRELEYAELIERIVVPSTPVLVRYELTERGRDLLDSIQPLIDYGQRWEHAPEERSAVS